MSRGQSRREGIAAPVPLLLLAAQAPGATALLPSLQPNFHFLQTMTRDHQHNPDPNVNAARSAGDSRPLGSALRLILSGPSSLL